MVKSRSEIAAVVRRYVDSLEAQGIRVERVYLFGSYLRGQANEWSDVDIVVVSADFAGKEFWELPPITALARYQTYKATGESVEALARTPEDVFSAHPAGFLAHVLKDAAVIYERAPAAA